MSEQQTIRDFLATLRPEAAQFPAGDDLFEAGLVDSFGMIQLVGFVESSFAIRLTDDEMTAENFRSLDAIAALVAAKRAAA
jgi:acyl carrier protein